MSVISVGMTRVASLIIAVTLALSACGGGGGGGGASAAAPAFHNVTISWSANHEKGVNSAGGGYKVTISGQATPIDVPYVSGTTAPTSTVVSLYTGNYTATVKAYAALDSSGGATGSTSASSVSLAIVVP